MWLFSVAMEHVIVSNFLFLIGKRETVRILRFYQSRIYLIFNGSIRKGNENVLQVE